MKELTKEQIEEKKNNGWYKDVIDEYLSFYLSNVYRSFEYRKWNVGSPYTVDYFDENKKMHSKEFKYLKDAKAFAMTFKA